MQQSWQEKVRDRARERGLNTNALGHIAGCSGSLIRMWLRGERPLNEVYCRPLADALGLPLAALPHVCHLVCGPPLKTIAAQQQG
jgi:hypothetical protein